MADRSLAPLSDWLAGPHPSCNGRFVVPRRSVCTRLHASGSLDNPVPSRSPTPANHPTPTWPTDHPRRSRRPPSVSRIISKYNHGLHIAYTYTRAHVYARVHVCVHVCRWMRLCRLRARVEYLYARNAHSLTYTRRCPSRGPRAIFSRYVLPLSLLFSPLQPSFPPSS